MRPAVPISVVLFALALCSLQQCDDINRVDPPPLVEPKYVGMRLVESSGDVVILGSRDSLARADEFPPMRVEFTYDFWMDRTEVTQAEYYRTMARLPREYGGHPTSADHPVAYVSWYDAVRYCNQRSILAGLDTVYAYSRADSTSDGTVYALHNLQIHLASEGYRLPTEAEWEFAAHRDIEGPYVWGSGEGDAAEHAWYDTNTPVAAQPVGLLRPNRSDLFDMAGNVMEWVNDYKGPLADTLVQDFAGPPSSQTDERPVKGGSFAHDISHLRPSSRSDTYETYSSTTARYIGFRCVLGRVVGPDYLAQGNTDAGDSAAPWASYTTKWVTPTARTKLAFVKRVGSSRTLCHVDYFDIDPKVTEFVDMENVYLPTVSPDGEWVAFCTNGEGMRENSSVYVRRMDSTGTGLLKLADEPAFVPRWWADPHSRDTFLVYTNSSVLNSAPSWGQTATYRQRMSGGTPVGSPELLEDAGSYHGGLSADAQYLVTGFPLLFAKDRQSGIVHTLFTAPRNGKQTPDTSQVCNVSVSPSHTHPHEVLLVDFGSYGQTSTVTGTPYGVHEYLFRLGLDNRVRGAYRCPWSAASWDHPEWSTDYRVAVAGVQDHRGRHPAIYVIGLGDSSVAAVVQSNSADLLHPFLWVATEPSAGDEGLELDSLGYYAVPRGVDAHAAQASKMSRFWRMHSDIELLFLGSSRPEGNVAAAQFSSHVALNLAAPGVGLHAIDGFLRDYALTHCPDLRLVCISLHPGWMADTAKPFQWNEGVAQSVGYAYDSNHAFWEGGLPGNFAQHVSNAPGAYDGLPDSDRGQAKREALGWRHPMFAGPSEWTTEDTCYQSSLALLGRMAEYLAARGIRLLAVAHPQAPVYRVFTHLDIRYYGRYGPRLTTAEEIWEDMAELEQANPYFHFYDAHQFGWHDYVNEDSYDADHLSWIGAEKFTARLDSVVHTILQ